MSERRFTHKPVIDSSGVMALSDDHPAMVENRTLFPSTVVTVTATVPDRLLISGVNNRKLGKTVEKGKFSGYALYQLSLEERATCPGDCDARAICYGNGMQMARRHRIGDPEIFFARLEEEIKALLEIEKGLLIRLHVLGDFPSVEYVAFWLDILNEYPKVACFGYTHRRPSYLEGDEIGDAIEALKDQFPDRFRIRTSFSEPLMDGAMIVDEAPEQREIDGVRVIACPAQTDATACCATCALCWETSGNAILFLKHGRSSSGMIAQQAAADAPTGLDGTRPIGPIKLPAKHPAAAVSGPPVLRLVWPTDLRVEPSYQRSLSTRSVALIRKIVTEWSWSKFKPPVCAETKDGLFVIDGQHTAIAAASHPGRFQIPVLIADVAAIEDRADSFIAHNRDRLAMSQFEIFHAEIAAGKIEAMKIAEAASKAGAVIPRAQPVKGQAKVGQIAAISELRAILRRPNGFPHLVRLLSILTKAGLAPINVTPLRALDRLLNGEGESHWRRATDDALAGAVASIKDIDLAARTHAAVAGMDRTRACVRLIGAALDTTHGAAA